MTQNFVMMHSNTFMHTSNIILYHRQQVKQRVHCICVSVCGETRCDDWFWGQSARPRLLRAPRKTDDSVDTI